MKWIYENQLGRRNLTDFSRVELKVKYGDILQRAKERQSCGQGGKLLMENSPKATMPINTREEIAKETGVPEWQTRQSIEIIKKGTEEQKQRARDRARESFEKL
jgi:formylmethanofuran dehydrogenase subunit D